MQLMSFQSTNETIKREQSPPSGLYWIGGGDGSETTLVQVYCDMDSWHSVCMCVYVCICFVCIVCVC